jgi:6-phosphofructokinase 1
VIGGPKTIDNDLVGIDHCPGFGSAAKYIAAVFAELEQEMCVYDTKSVIVVEMMGRHAGWLTAAAALADVANVDVPYLIYLEERPFSIDRFIDDLNAKLKDYDAVMIAVSEGVHDENGVFICESVAASKGVDVFGHVQLSGTGKILENAIRDRIGCKVRSIELNLLQRCASHILSATDIEESMLLGENAVKLAVSRQSGLMSSLRRVSDSPYRVVYEGVDIQKVANAEKKIPQNWINKAGNNVTQECINYLRPLVAGEMTCKFKDGVPDYMILK